MPKASIIIPCYNLGQYLNEAVDSVLAQTYQDFEIIIVNDGSTDEFTNSLLANYDKPKTRVLTTENQGLPSARNNGIRISSGKYVCCLDADDYFHPEYLEKTVKVLDEDTEHIYGFVATWVQLFDEENYIWENFNYNPYRLAAENGIHVASLFRKQCWEEVRGYATNLSGYQDWDFWIAIVEKGYKWETISQPLSYYRKRHDSMLKTSDTKSVELYKQIIDNHAEFFSRNFREILLEFKSIRESRINDYKDAIRYLRGKEFDLANKNEELNNHAHLLEELRKELMVKDEKFAVLDHQLAERDLQLTERDQQLTERDQQLAERDQQLTERDQQLAERDQQLAERDQHKAELTQQLAERERQLAELNQNLVYRESKIQELLNSYSWKITAPVRRLANIVLPAVKNIRAESRSTDASEEVKLELKAYHVKLLYPVEQIRPRIVHALANFMTGGSSRLVIDLIEHLGHLYEQEVITSHRPNPPCYTGLEVHELTSPQRIIEYFREFRPSLLHVHYWGECDKGWYEQVFSAAKDYGCKIIENINTPVEPYFSDSIDSYVYVSNYVLEHFGKRDDKSIVIYPGSNFKIFSRCNSSNNIPDNCIGMVYRLETDKLNDQSINAFIKVAKLRPDIKVLIVGGGTYLETYRNAASAQGVLKSFTFTGYVSYEELPRLYEQLSIFVAPVWKESFGQVSPFAMNMGIPVVGYDVGGLAEIVGDKKLLAFPGDSDHLAAIIIDLLDNRQKRLAIGKINRDRAQKLFSVDVMVEHYEELYRKLLERQS